MEICVGDAALKFLMILRKAKIRSIVTQGLNNKYAKSKL